MRRFPRFNFDGDGVVVADGEWGLDLVDVKVRCLSCDGAGIELDGASEHHIWPGRLVHLRFDVPTGPAVDLLARVMWAAAGKAGLRLRLDETDRDSKKSFGSWIAPLTKARLKGAADDS
jgi:hypothetical protein